MTWNIVDNIAISLIYYIVYSAQNIVTFMPPHLGIFAPFSCRKMEMVILGLPG